MRRRFPVTVLVVVAVLAVVYGFLLYREPSPALASTITADKPAAVASVALNWPDSEAAIGASGYGVLTTHDPQQALPTASVAKVMNALMVLKAHPLASGQQGPTLTMTQVDVNVYNSYVAEDGSVAKVALGENITEYQLLEAMLLPSADNIADTLATWSYGSIDAYSAAANTYAKSLGMTDSHFGTADASGYSPETVSTAHDLVVLGEAALKNPIIAQIVAEKSAVVPVAGTVQNVNWMLGSHGIDGIKTGNTNQAGGVFLFSAKQQFANGQSVTIVGAIMDQPTLAQALDVSAPLLSSAEAHFSLKPLVTSGQVMGRYVVPWGGTDDAVAAKSLSAVVWNNQIIAPKVSLDKAHAPIAAKQQVGTASFGTSSSAPIIVEQPITRPTLHWRLLHVF